jgi:hypothetical protein
MCDKLLSLSHIGDKTRANGTHAGVSIASHSFGWVSTYLHAISPNFRWCAHFSTYKMVLAVGFQPFACTLSGAKPTLPATPRTASDVHPKHKSGCTGSNSAKTFGLPSEQFLEKYGIDDTVRAMVYLFARKKTAGIVKLAVSPVLSGAAMLFLVVAVFGVGPESIVATFLTAALYDYAFYGGIIPLIKYPRIRWIEAIQDHKAGLPYPKNTPNTSHPRTFKKVPENSIISTAKTCPFELVPKAS